MRGEKRRDEMRREGNEREKQGETGSEKMRGDIKRGRI